MKYLIYIILEFKQYLWSGNQNNETLIVIDDNNTKRNRVDTKQHEDIYMSITI